MLPTTPYTVAMFRDELTKSRDHRKGYKHLYDLDATHPIYNGLDKSPVIMAIHEAASKAGFVRAECAPCLHASIDLLIDIIGRNIYQILNQIDPIALSTVAMSFYCDRSLLERLEENDPNMPVREVMYANTLARFSREVAPSQAGKNLIHLLNLCQAPYSAHQRAIAVFNVLERSTPLVIQ